MFIRPHAQGAAPTKRFKDNAFGYTEAGKTLVLNNNPVNRSANNA